MALGECGRANGGSRGERTRDQDPYGRLVPASLRMRTRRISRQDQTNNQTNKQTVRSTPAAPKGRSKRMALQRSSACSSSEPLLVASNREPPSQKVYLRSIFSSLLENYLLGCSRTSAGSLFPERSTKSFAFTSSSYHFWTPSSLRNCENGSCRQKISSIILWIFGVEASNVKEPLQRKDCFVTSYFICFYACIRSKVRLKEWFSFVAFCN
mmetsp:Transcript_7645/g.15175  ORF Transcript_7645/g.15175 Transcript_7645/m.15175 type:complete len:211 (-) Transcript_7645:49-681(-)